MQVNMLTDESLTFSGPTPHELISVQSGAISAELVQMPACVTAVYWSRG